MVKRLTLLILVLVAAAGLLSAGTVLLSTRADKADAPVPATADGAKPPVTRTVADFTPLDPPRPAPAQPFADEAGTPVSLEDFRGRVVLLNFWATWCAPCLEEMPSLDRLQAKLGGRGLAVVALSQDRGGAAQVRPFYERLGLSRLDIYLDPRNQIGRELGVQGLPTTVLIDRRGQAVGMLVGPADWDSPDAIALIERYLDAPPDGDGLPVRTGGEAQRVGIGVPEL